MMYKPETKIPVVLIRHAQSQWNKENRFTGWADPPLTEQGVRDAIQASNCLRSNGCRFDIVYSSRLERAINTAELIVKNMVQGHIPLIQDWRLNERHYGALQGKDKQETEMSAGGQQVWRWRRGYYDRAEPLLASDVCHPVNDSRYADIEAALLPAVENLAETRERVSKFWTQVIEPQIQDGRRILISAHGNTLRALVMALSRMTVEEVEAFEIPTAMPIVYWFNEQGEALDWYYLPACDDQQSA